MNIFPFINYFCGFYYCIKETLFCRFFCSWLVYNYSFIYISENNLISLSGIYVVHIAAPLESLALSLWNFVGDKNEKEKLLIHKSKLASMGEMINNISHQCRKSCCI